MGFRGAGFAFCLFPAAPPPPGGPPCRPYQHSGQGYHMDGREEAVLGALRAYLAASQGRPQLGGAPTQYLRRIKDVRPRQFFDVLARVVAADDSNPHLRLLYIWDGSDVLPFPAA